MVARVRPIVNVPALRVDRGPSGTVRTLLIADLHLGLGGAPDRPAGPPAGSAGDLAEQLLRICRRERAPRLLVAGDIKHPIVGTPRWLRPVIFDFFSELLAGGVATEVVLGNHDVGLVPHLPREVDVAPASGRVLGGLGIFHGHRWPSEEVLACRTLIAGHLHPGYRFAPSPAHPDGKRRCWIRTEFALPPPRRGPRDRSGRLRTFRAREMIVLPAFNPLAGAESLNRERPARGRSFLFQRFLARGTPRAYLLDGTDLGAIPTGARRPPVRAARRARPRR